MRLLVALLFIFSPFCHSLEWKDEHCDSLNAYKGKVFSLTISTSFHGDVTFKLCNQREENTSIYLLAITEETEQKLSIREAIETGAISLTSLNRSQYEKINQLFDLALESNLKDTRMSMDGSNWCLESQRGFTYSKFCFHSPPSDHEARGISGLYLLGVHLWELSNLNDRENLKLY